MKSAVVTFAGRPSAGKSTLINGLCGEKVAIVSPKPQTTRNAIRGILHRPEGELIFVDTPGYHISEKAFNVRLGDVFANSLAEADILLYVIDASRHPGAEEKRLTETLAKSAVPIVAVLNKTDLEPLYIHVIQEYLEALNPIKTISVSAMRRKGLDGVISALLEIAPEGPALYPEDIYTDQPPEFRIGEVIREKAIFRTGKEIPYSLRVEIADTTYREEQGELWVRAFLMVERESQKGIVVGKGGKKIKAIRLEAQRELSALFPYKVSLDLRVKVDKEWSKRRDVTTL